MGGFATRLVVGAFFVCGTTGCAWVGRAIDGAGAVGSAFVSELGPWGGPAYTVDSDKLGTGQQAVELRNDSAYCNGEAMDARKRR